MKKIIAFVLLAAMVSVMLIGCTATPAQPVSTETEAAAPAEAEATTETTNGERKVISMWFWSPATEYQEHMNKVLCDWYNSSQDEYQLVVEFRNAADTDILVALAAGEGPDIVCCDGSAGITKFANEGLIINMSKYDEQYGWKDRTLSALYDICTVDGDLYAVPGGLLSGGLFYNKEVFAENGWEVPNTLEEMETVMAAAKEKGLYPLSAGNKGWKPCNSHFGSMIMDAYVSPTVLYDALKGTTTFSDDRIKATIQKSKDWYEAGYLAGSDYINLDSSEVMLTLCQKKAAMAIVPTLYFQWVDPAVADTIGFKAMPNAFTDHDVYNVSMAISFGINANSKCPDESAKIIDHMLTAQFSLDMSAAWPAYWVMPVKELATIDTSSLTGLSKVTFEAVQESITAIDEGYFSYHASTYFPSATIAAFIEIDNVWENVQSVDDYCNMVSETLKQDIADGLVPPLAKPVC